MSSRRRRNEAPAEDVDDIWKIASTNKVTQESGVNGGNESSGENSSSFSSSQGETFSLFVGQKQAGKTSLVTAFHNPSKDDVPKPTVGLEYLFARRNAGTNQPKDIANIWELGGGARLSSLVSVPITPQTIANAVIIIVIDLSQVYVVSLIYIYVYIYFCFLFIIMSSFSPWSLLFLANQPKQ